MVKLNLTKKTGFSTVFPFKIFDIDKKLFYSSEFVDKIENGKRLNFNLPAGSYFYDGFFERLPKPVEFKKIELPKPQRYIENKGYRIIWGNNPNKCTIDYNKRTILYDNSIKELPLFVRYNIYFHEIGHHLYESEKYADLYAAKKMLEFGFNPSQIGLSNILALSEKQKDRKNFIIKNHLKSI